MPFHRPSLDLPIEAISHYLLDLHRSCRELPLRSFQERCFEGLREVFPFDSGILGTGTLQLGVPQSHDFYLHRQTPELMESWQSLRHLDIVATTAMSRAGRTQRFAIDEVFADYPKLVAHCRTFGIAHVLCTAAIAERAGSVSVLSIYRADPEQPFSDGERATMELLVPHIVESMRQARLDQLRRATKTSRPENQSAAIVSRAGVVLEAEPGFVELLVEADPLWSGPWLPSKLAALANATTNERHVIGELVVRADPSEDLVLLHARRANALDELTERERQVADLFASGESAKGIAEQLGIALNTVRVHVARIYEKLGVVNKAELASTLLRRD